MKTIVIEKLKDKKQFEAIKWVIKAIPKDKNNPLYYSDKIYIGKNRIAGTSSKRLHIAKHHRRDLLKGVYRIETNTKEKIVLKQIEGYYPKLTYPLRLVREGLRLRIVETFPGSAYTRLIRNLDENISLNYNHFNDCIRESKREWMVRYDPKGLSPICLRNGERMAILMPYLIHEEVNYYGKNI